MNTVESPESIVSSLDKPDTMRSATLWGLISPFDNVGDKPPWNNRCSLYCTGRVRRYHKMDCTVRFIYSWSHSQPNPIFP